MSTKRIIAALAAATIALSACGGGEGDSTGTKGGDGSGIIEISIFAGSLPENSPTGEGVKAMISSLEAANVGIVAEGFYDTSLGDATTMIQGMQQGTIDIGVSGNSYYSGLVPEIQVFELPFLFDDIESARNATAEGPARDAVFALFDQTDIVGLSLWEGGMRQLSNNVREVRTPDDLKGIKMRTLPAPIQQAVWSELGALPQSIDAAELYTALQQGTVSAQENPLYEIVFRNLYEVQDHVTLTSHVYTPFTMGVSRITWDRLSDEQKSALKEAAEAGRQAQLAANDAAEEDARQELLDNGVQIVEDPDREAFSEIAQQVWPMFTDEYGEDLLETVQEASK